MLKNDLDEWLRKYNESHSAEREVLLWENADADIPAFLAICKKENVAVKKQHSRPKGNMTNRQMMS